MCYFYSYNVGVVFEVQNSFHQEAQARDSQAEAGAEQSSTGTFFYILGVYFIDNAAFIL